MLRIIDKTTMIFLRDDFNFDEEKEIGLGTEPAQGLYRPKWDGNKWIEDMTTQEIEALKNQAQELSNEEVLKRKVDEFETKMKTIDETMLTLMGGIL